MSDFKVGDYVEMRGDRGVVVHIERCAGPNIVVRRSVNGQIGLFFAGELNPVAAFDATERWVRVDRYGKIGDYLYVSPSDVPPGDLLVYAVIVPAVEYARLTTCRTCDGGGSVMRDDGRDGLVNDSCPDCTKAAS